MAKTPKVKKREVSLHSRAARRGASPTVEITTQAPRDETEYKPWLHSAQNAGISKKSKVKTLTRQQRLRQQRGLEKADANMNKLEKKVADSKSRSRKVISRAADWEDLNGELAAVKDDKAVEKARKKAIANDITVRKELSETVDGLAETMEDVALPVSKSSLSAMHDQEKTQVGQELVGIDDSAAVEELDEVT